MEFVEAHTDRSSLQHSTSRRSSTRRQSQSSKPSLRLSVQFPKPPRSNVSAPSSAVTVGHGIHSGTMASRSETSLHTRCPVKPVNGMASRSMTSLRSVGPPLSPIPYTKPLPPPPGSSPPTVSPLFVELPGSPVTREYAPSPLHSPPTFSPLVLHLPISPSTPSPTTIHHNPSVPLKKTRVSHLLLNLGASPSDPTFKFSPTTGASTASPSTICSGSDHEDNDLEEAGGSPISSAGEPVSPPTMPSRGEKARLGREEQRPLSLEDQFGEMIEANSREEMRVTHILSRRVSSLQQDLEKRDAEVKELSLELEALKATSGQHQAPIRESLVSSEAISARKHLEQQLDELQVQVRAKDAQIADLENEVYMWKDDVDMLEDSITRLCDNRQQGVHNVRVQDRLMHAFDDVERTLAQSEAITAGLKVKKTVSKRKESKGMKTSSSSSSEEGSPRMTTEQCATCSNRPAVEGTDFLKRSKDLEARIAAQVEDIRLYKLDVRGYKKDIRERDAKIRELQHTVLSLQARLGEKEGQVLLSDVPLGIDFGGVISELPASRPPPAPPSMGAGSGSASSSSGMLQVQASSLRPRTPEHHQLETSSSSTAPPPIPPARVYPSRSASKARLVATPPKFDTITEETPTPLTATFPEAHQPVSSSISIPPRQGTASPPIVISGTNTTVTSPAIAELSASPAKTRTDATRTSPPSPPRQIIIPRKTVGGGSHSANTSPVLTTQSPTSHCPPQQREGEEGKSSTDGSSENGNAKVEEPQPKTTLVRYPTGKDINKGGKWEDPFLF